MSAGRTIYVASVTAALLLTGCSKSEPTETVEINCENGWRLVREKPVAWMMRPSGHSVRASSRPPKSVS